MVTCVTYALVTCDGMCYNIMNNNAYTNTVLTSFLESNFFLRTGLIEHFSMKLNLLTNDICISTTVPHAKVKMKINKILI